MKQKVMIQIYGSQDIDGQTDKQELTVEGEYYEQGGKRFLLYEEPVEGGVPSVRTIVKESPACIEVVKNGGVSVKMHFETGKSVNSSYKTPMGVIALRIVTENVKKESREKGFVWEMAYALHMDGQFVGNNVLRLDVERKD